MGHFSHCAANSCRCHGPCLRCRNILTRMEKRSFFEILDQNSVLPSVPDWGHMNFVYLFFLALIFWFAEYQHRSM